MGSALQTQTGNSSNCQNEQGGEIIKAAFIVKDTPGAQSSWIPFAYTGDNSPTLGADWDVSGSVIGTYALMIKAYSVDASGNPTYIDGTKKSTDVVLTNASVETPGDNPTYVADRLPTGNALLDPRGSSYTSVKELATTLLTKTIPAALGGIAVIAILIGGILYITAGGDEKKTERGKKTVIYAMVGVAIAGSMWAIMNLVLDLIHQIFG
jgi:hypothetical protein